MIFLFSRFCDMSGGSRKFNIITILKDSVTNNYVVTNLRKFTKYEFFLIPFFRNIEGQPSNSKDIQTLEVTKELSLCYKPKFSNPYILATWCCNHLIINIDYWIMVWNIFMTLCCKDMSVRIYIFIFDAK